MRFFDKGEPNHKLQNRHQNPPVTSDEARRAWRNFRRKSATHEKCMLEQQGLCAYSEVALYPDSKAGFRSLGSHLEHIKLRSKHPESTFDHHNLIVSAVSDEELRRLAKDEVFGGHARNNWHNPEAFIHPLLGGCSDYFHYNGEGRVVPNITLPRREQAKARLTAYKLNLNAQILVNWRKKRIVSKNILREKILNSPHPDFARLRRLIRTELLPQNGQLKPFHSAIRQLFGPIAEEVMVEAEPTGANTH